MTTRAESLELNLAHVRDDQPIGRLRFDWIMIALSTWFLGGLFVDGWAHAHGRVDNTFFTPWHAIFYSGFLAVATGLAIVVHRNHARGHRWLQAVPAGYELSLLGAVIFAVGGLGDMTWHILFGIEMGTEALLSPTHLTLALGLTLIVSGPFRAAWQRVDDESRWARLFPMLISLTFTLSILTFFTEYANPIAIPWPLFHGNTRGTQNLFVSLGIDSILMYAALLIGTVLLTIRRWKLPFGAITLVFTLNAVSLCVFDDMFLLIPVLLVAGLTADILVKLLRPSEERRDSFRLFAFAVPLILYLLYFLDLMLISSSFGTSVRWSIHLWMGSAVMAGFVGVLLSFLLLPPAKPVKQG